MSERMESLLEQILHELQEINEKVRNPEPTPAHPAYFPQPIGKSRGCNKCGINLSGANGYVCTAPDCPTGHGPVTC